MSVSFFKADEEKMMSAFLRDGYTIFPLDQSGNQTFSELKQFLFEQCKDFLKLPADIDQNKFFDETHKYLPVAQLNELKLHLIGQSTKSMRFHPGIYQLAKKAIDLIVGNELCMQRVLNLSIQLPKDNSALLPLHTDVWSGNSPYEAVLWFPLVDCYKTKSMYVLPLQKSMEVFKNFSRYEKMDAETLFRSLEKDVIFLEVPEGHAVLFTHSILHGNRVNDESTTRWTFNIRFKSLMSPYGLKDLGETFFPITVRPMTRIGYENFLPKIVNQ